MQIFVKGLNRTTRATNKRRRTKKISRGALNVQGLSILQTQSNLQPGLPLSQTRRISTKQHQPATRTILGSVLGNRKLNTNIKTTNRRNTLTQFRFYSDFKEVDSDSKSTTTTKAETPEDMNLPDLEGLDTSDPKTQEMVKNMKKEMPDLSKGTPGASGEKSDLPATEGKQAPKEVLIEETEKPGENSETKEFQADTKKILDIVSRSLYSEREVFIRELISNCSDALEKIRQKQILGHEIEDPDLPLEIRISANEKENTLTIQDFGVGMSKNELISNLGRIGQSGTAEFLKALDSGKADQSNLIGQFGVGFYSAFMVGDLVKVYSKAAGLGSQGYFWTSDGTGTYNISEAEGVQRGTKIIVKLRDTAKEFCKKQTVENVIKKYSNFVGFPITVNGTQCNTVRAIWLESAHKVTVEQHKEFYQFIAHAYDTPSYTLMYKADSPISIRAVFYFPAQHMEKYGMGKMDPGVSLFSRKVLIQAKSKGLLPEWLRFVKGVVDSEDLPLNLSREFLQDSQIVKRLNTVLTRRILRYLSDESKKDPKKYEQWFSEYGHFLKEGICTDFQWKEDIARLLRIESSKTGAGKFTTLDDYIKRMKDEQKDIFFLSVPNRQTGLASPYFEAFKERGIEVLFCYRDIDDFVMSNLSEYMNYKLQTIESANAADLAKSSGKKEDQDVEEETALSEEEFSSFAKWFKDTLKDRVSNVDKTDRLSGTPAIVVDHESATFRRMMTMVDPQRQPKAQKQQIHINPKHPLILNLNRIRSHNKELAKDIAEQILDNAMIQAGILDDPRNMVPRLTKLMEKALAQN